ncbi:hypothetical protein [Halopelagius fulvigenes]|uniref:Uncharacterized protein n=1 Tax=Halopelagius fulvigenes TaxID=1198324 RepID=A0ABD5TXQ1_9EURY
MGGDRRRGDRTHRTPRLAGGPRDASIPRRRVAALALFVVALVGVTVAVGAMDRPTLFNRPPPWFGAVFLAPTLGAIATVGAVGHAARAWYRGEWSLASRLHYSPVVAASAVLYWLLRYWNLLVVRA